MGQFHKLGKAGEDIAAKYLLKLGYQILCKNYRYLKAEIDLIARKDNSLIIVEVKTRSDSFYEDLSETVSVRKRKLLTMAADHFICEQELDLEVRFDIITLVRKRGGFTVEHVEDAFYHF